MKAYTIIEVLVVLAVLAVIAVGGIIIVAVCNAYLDSQITEGKVVNKEFVAAHTRTMTNYYKVGNVNVPITTRRHHPDTYYIYLKGYGKSGKIRTRQVAIDRQSYMILEIGYTLKLSDIPLTPTAERE